MRRDPYMNGHVRPDSPYSNPVNVNYPFAAAAARQTIFNVDEVLDMMGALTNDAAPYSNKLAEDCLGVDLSKLADKKTGTMSAENVKEVKELYQNAVKCVNKIIDSAVETGFETYVKALEYGQTTFFHREGVPGIEIDKKSKYAAETEKMTAMEQFRFFTGKLKPYLDSEIIGSSHSSDNTAIRGGLKKAKHILETAKIEEWYDQAYKIWKTSGAPRGKEKEFINTLIRKDSKNIKNLAASVEGAENILKHYEEASETLEAKPSKVDYKERLRELNSNSPFKLDDTAIDRILSKEQANIENLESRRNTFSPLGKSKVFNQLADRYLASLLAAEYNQEKNHVKIDCGRCYYVAQLNQLINIATKHYPEASGDKAPARTAEEAAKLEKACLEEMYHTEKRMIGEMARQSKDDVTTMNETNYDLVKESKSNSQIDILAAAWKYMKTQDYLRPNTAAQGAGYTYEAYADKWLHPLIDNMSNAGKETVAAELLERQKGKEQALPESYRPYIKSVVQNNNKVESYFVKSLGGVEKGLETLLWGAIQLSAFPTALVSTVTSAFPARLSMASDKVFEDDKTLLNVPGFKYEQANPTDREQYAKVFQQKALNCINFVNQIKCIAFFWKQCDSLKKDKAKFESGVAARKGIKTDTTKKLDPLAPIVRDCMIDTANMYLGPNGQSKVLDAAIGWSFQKIGNCIKDPNLVDSPEKIAKEKKETDTNLALANVLVMSERVHERTTDDRKQECGTIGNNRDLLNLMTEDGRFNQLLGKGKLLSEAQVEALCDCFDKVLKQNEQGQIVFNVDAVDTNSGVRRFKPVDFVRGAIATAFLKGNENTKDLDPTLLEELQTLSQNAQKMRLKGETQSALSDVKKAEPRKGPVDFGQYCKDELIRIEAKFGDATKSSVTFHNERIRIALIQKNKELYDLQEKIKATLETGGNTDALIARRETIENDIQNLTKQKEDLAIVAKHKSKAEEEAHLSEESKQNIRCKKGEELMGEGDAVEKQPNGKTVDGEQFAKNKTSVQHIESFSLEQLKKIAKQPNDVDKIAKTKVNYAITRQSLTLGGANYL